MGQILRAIAQAGRTFGRGLLHLVYPRICWVCQQIQPIEENAVCAACAATLVSDTRPTCHRCASTVGPFVDTTQGCQLCRNEKFAFDRAFRLGPYEGPLREVVLRMKSSHGEGLAEVFGAFWAGQMARRLGPLMPDLVLPVPLHWRRHYQRGFNQSAVLAQALAAKLRIPCEPGRLQRWQATADQKSLQGQSRRENVKGAFRLRPGNDVADKTIILVDDVLTTGATASETAKPLRTLKPKSIVLAVLAHGF
jgi:ComF family protein